MGGHVKKSRRLERCPSPWWYCLSGRCKHATTIAAAYHWERQGFSIPGHSESSPEWRRIEWSECSILYALIDLDRPLQGNPLPSTPVALGIGGARLQSQPKRADSGSAGIFYGWRLVPVRVLVNTISSLNSAAATVFFLPISQEFGMSRATLALVFSMSRLVGGIEGPLAGWLIDRYGPRFPAALGAVLGGTGFLLLATAHSPWSFLLVFLGMMSVGFNIGGVHAMLSMANLWFVRYHTRVLSVFSSAIRLGPPSSHPCLPILCSPTDGAPGRLSLEW